MRMLIKNMVSLRCKLKVQEELKKLGFHKMDVKLGEVELFEEMTSNQREQFRKELSKSGLELMDDKKVMLVEKIKNAIIELVHFSEELPSVKLSHYLSEKLNYDYTYLANTFSAKEGITLAHFVLLQKVERIKELLLYDELNLTQISYLMNYSSLAALSNQFKKITGITPSDYKHLRDKKRRNLEDLSNQTWPKNPRNNEHSSRREVRNGRVLHAV